MLLRHHIVRANTFRYLLTGFLLISSFVSVRAQENLSVLSYWKYYDGQSGAMYRHVCEQAFNQIASRKKNIQALKTRLDWQRRQQGVRQKLQQAIGPLPQKTPLHAVITGTLERDGIRAEKLYIESMPNYYVTATLFLPISRSGKVPAILFCSGHSANGFRSKAYQQIMLNYVKKGFAVLAFDPIGQGERLYVTRTDGSLRQNPTHQHSYAGAQSFVAGVSPALYFIWDGIRAIDYLLTRPEIDAARIGVAGRSGGGTQTAFIAALDTRIVAAAPEAYLTSFDKLLRSNGPQDAEQNLMGFLAKGLDMADLVEVRAPKPTLMVTTTRDIFSIDGARETFREAQTAYKTLGAAENLTMVEDDAEHTSTKKNREAAYAFFQTHLRNPGTPTDEPVTYFSDQELQVTLTGNVYTALKGETIFSVTTKRFLKPKQSTPALPISAQTLRSQVIASTGFVAPKLKEVIFSGNYPRQGYTIEKYIINGPGAYYLPILWLRPSTESREVLLYIHEKGKAAVMSNPAFVEQLLQAGYEVVLPDLSGAGELAKTYLPGGDSFIDSTSFNLWYAGILTHKSLVAVRMEEMLLVTEFIKKTRKKAVITAVGTGIFTPELLHAALVSESFERIALLNGLVSYRSLVETESYQARFIPSVVAGALPQYDLPDLVTTLASRPILLAGTTDAAGQVMDPGELGRLYQSDSKSQLQLIQDTQPERLVQALLNWQKQH